MQDLIIEKVISYKTSDGKIFSNYAKALRHQKIFNFVEKFDYDYLESTKETIREFMIDHFNELGEFFVHENKIAPPREDI